MHPQPSVAAVPRRRLADDLLAGMAAGEIEPRFQPQVAMADGRITGVEALARWRHGRLGELGAERLFAAAARAELSPELSLHIQGAALAHVAAWPARLAGLTVALNVTAGDVARTDFAAGFLEQAEKRGIDVRRLTVEITEHELIADLDRAARELAALREVGVGIALDDFGTGYSSIAYLKALPLDHLKIDGRLSGDLLGSPRDQVVVRHVIAMARGLGLKVIAEGVESEEHRLLLAEAGATHYQGFLCAAPLGSVALVRFMEQRCAD